jgi:ketosteroid isomerase-like protein
MREPLPLVLFALLLFLSAGCGGGAPPVDREAEIAAVRDAVYTSIQWCIPEKDTEKLYRHVAPDSTFFMFQPSSRSTILGADHFRRFAEAIFMDPRFTAVSSDIRELRIHLSSGGDVAWFSCLLDDHGIWDGEPVAWLNCRWTGVLEKRDGHWYLVQQHFSLPTDAAEESEESAAE